MDAMTTWPCHQRNGPNKHNEEMAELERASQESFTTAKEALDRLRSGRTAVGGFNNAIRHYEKAMSGTATSFNRDALKDLKEQAHMEVEKTEAYRQDVLQANDEAWWDTTTLFRASYSRVAGGQMYDIMMMIREESLWAEYICPVISQEEWIYSILLSNGLTSSDLAMRRSISALLSDQRSATPGSRKKETKFLMVEVCTTTVLRSALENALSLVDTVTNASEYKQLDWRLGVREANDARPLPYIRSNRGSINDNLYQLKKGSAVKSLKQLIQIRRCLESTNEEVWIIRTTEALMLSMRTGELYAHEGMTTRGAAQGSTSNDWGHTSVGRQVMDDNWNITISIQHW
jgi:hypothetical protein